VDVEEVSERERDIKFCISIEHGGFNTPVHGTVWEQYLRALKHIANSILI